MTCVLALSCEALTVNEVPNPRQVSGGWVTDMANVLQPETEAQLNQMIDRLEQRNGAEIAVVTVPETKPSVSPKAFATELFNHWHIGKKDRNNGVLFLISTGDRRVEIETGIGVEAFLPDSRVSDIIQQEVTPRFKQGDFDGGALAGTSALVVVLERQEPVPDSLSLWWPIGAGILWVTLALLRYRRPIGRTAQVLGGFLTYQVLRQPLYLKPEGQSRMEDWHQSFELTERMCCCRCEQPLQPVSTEKVRDRLTSAQKVAEELGSVHFKGWRCPKCAPDAMHIRGYERTSSEVIQCPRCKELTALKQESIVIEEPGFFRNGVRRIVYVCQCCFYYHEVELPIGPQSNTPYGTWGSWSNDSNGGSSFGGGDSGGGGGGGGW